MANIDIQNLNSNTVPFFTRFLEEQICQDLSEEEIKAVGGLTLDPRFIITLKAGLQSDDFENFLGK